MFILLFTFFSHAVPYCEQFDGDAYADCVLSGKHDAAKITRRDINPAEEEYCHNKDKFADDKAVRMCLAGAREKAVSRAQKREMEERAALAAKPKAATPEPPEKDAVAECDDKRVKFHCTTAFENVAATKNSLHMMPMAEQNDAMGNAVSDCLAKCSRTPTIDVKISSCQPDKLKKVTDLFAKFHPNCNTGSGASTNVKYNSAEGEEKLSAMASGMMDGSYIGDVKTCGALECTSKKSLDHGISMVASSPTGPMQGVSNVFYTDAEGTRYNSYTDALAAAETQQVQLPIRVRRDNYSVNAESIVQLTPPVQQTEGITTNIEPAPAAAPPIAKTTTPPATNASTPTTVQQNSTTVPQPINSQPFANTNFSNANPYSGTAFTGSAVETTNNFTNSANDSRFASNFDSEVTGSRGSSDYSGGSDGYAVPAARRSASYKGSEAVGGSGGSNGGGGSAVGLGGGSLGKGGGGSSSSGGRVAVASAGSRDGGDTLTGPFQNGYFKPSGTAGTSGAKMSGSLTEKQKKTRKRMKPMTDCNGNLKCIAEYLAKSKKTVGTASSRGGRGLASISSVNKEIGSGYGDIMSQMEKIHNKLPMDENGNLEVPR